MWLLENHTRMFSKIHSHIEFKKTISLFFSKLVVFLLSVSLVVISCNSFKDAPYPEVQFEQKSSFPDGGRSSAVSFVINDKAYVALGRNDVLKNDCYQYDPQLDKWKQVAAFPGIPRVNAVAATVDDEAYVGLGYNSDLGIYNADAILRDFWKYNPKIDAWTRLADFPASSTNKCIAFTFGQKIYVGFGFSGDKFERDIWQYNPESDTWTELPKNTSIPSRSGGVACAGFDYAYFGTGFNTHTLSDWWQFNSRTYDWKRLKNIPETGRTMAVAFSLEDRIFVGTGRFFQGTLTGGHLKEDLLEYDVQKNVWYHRGEMPNGGRENAVSFVVGGKAYIGLGENDSGTLDDLWVIHNL